MPRALGGPALTLASGMHSFSQTQGRPRPHRPGVQNPQPGRGVCWAGQQAFHPEHSLPGPRLLQPHEVGLRAWAQTTRADPTLPLLGGVPTSSPRSSPQRCFGPQIVPAPQPAAPQRVLVSGWGAPLSQLTELPPTYTGCGQMSA